MHNSIAVITVVYNNYTNLDDFFASFKKQTDKDFRVFVSDNSTERKAYEPPEFGRLSQQENKGYAYGLNQGLKLAQAEGFTKFIFINDDTIVHENFIKNAKASLEKNPGTLIGGKIYYAKGYEFHPTPEKDKGKVLWYAGGIMEWAHAWAKHRGVDEVDHGQYDTLSPTDFITGCLMIFDENFIKKFGLMDDSYFMYYEDTDWCARITKRGGMLVFDPSIVIWHKNSQSSGGSGSKLHEKYLKQNHLKFGLRYAPLRTKLHLLLNFFLQRK